MGAFGELLIQRWGGNLEYYRGDKVTKKEIEKTFEENTKEKEEIFFELKVLRARKHLSSLKSSLIYRTDEAKLYTESVIKNGFNKLGFEPIIQDKMWIEFSSFIDKYCKK
tara:strand:- start:10381 stop:10710 length:330 start_codon:yes stop_codon:yes gene_type:complete